MITGSLVALVTPMFADGAVDYPSLTRLIQWHLAQGTDGIVSVGTTGESATLGFDEHIRVVEHTVQIVKKRIPVIAGTGANATAEALELTQAAADVGADAALIVTPYYNKPPQEGLYRHYMTLADNVDLPQILYNVPGRTAVDMLPETTARLAAHPNIVGTKEALGKLDRIQALLDMCGKVDPNFAIYSGDDATAGAAMLMGAKGNISVTANVAPKAMHDVAVAALAGHADLVAKLDANLQILHRDLFIEANPIPVKYALHKMGKIGTTLRLPLVELQAQNEIIIEAALKAAGII